MRWLTWLRETREATAYMRVDVRDIRRAVVLQIPARLTRLETLMSADRDFLLELAQDLNDLAQPVDDLIADNAAKASLIEELRAENARLGGQVGDLQAAAADDESGDLDAARPAREALDLIRRKFAAKPDLPDITAPDAPAEPVADEPADEPVAAEPEVPAEQP